MASYTRTSYTIGLDARFDATQANLPTSDEDVERYEAAYEDAAEKIEAKHGISIRVLSTTYESAHEADHCDLDDEARALWQEIHDACSWTAR